MEQVMITSSEEKINFMLRDGYTIKSVTAQEVSTGGNSILKGSFLVVFFKEIP